MLKFISHRGNLTGPEPEKENRISTIEYVLSKGFDCEIDIRYIDNKFYLGHDDIQEEVSIKWLNQRGLWIHCKNIEAVEWFNELESIGSDFNYFWHQEDDVTLTSMNFIWAYPGKQPIRKSIAVMPELNNDDVSECKGICSDIIKNYNK